MLNILNLIFCLSLGIIVESELLHSKDPRVYARIDDSIIFKCCGKNNTDYVFFWYRDGVPIKNSTQYQITREKECSVLYISKITADDFNVQTWMANVSDCPSGCSIFMLNELRSIDSITTERNETLRGSVSRTEGEKLTLICRMRGEEGENITSHLSWQYKSEKSGAHYEPFYTGVTTTYVLNDSIKFEKLTKHQRGYYQCVLQHGNFTMTKSMLLRVRDKYAALWPFLGIIAEVIVLIILIFACEKRQSKKKKTYDDDQAGQTDTLMKNEAEKVNAAESEIKKRSGRH